MKRINLLLDDIATIRSTLANPDFDPAQLAVLGETAGAGGVSCTYSGTDKGISERDLRLLKELTKTFFNLRLPPREDVIHLALSLRPDMLTFVDVKQEAPRMVRPVDPNLLEEKIETLLPDLQANDISVAVLIQAEIGILKGINKLSLDYVEIDATDYTGAADINVELVALDKIRSATVAAGKLGMGVNCYGGIRYEHLPELARIANLEDITMGGQLIQRAMWVGIEKAVTEAIQILRLREID